MSSGSNTVTESADPWEGLQGPLANLYQSSTQWFEGNEPEYFPDSTVTPLSVDTRTALGLQKDRALSGSPLVDTGEGMLGDTLSGKYLDPESNPYLSDYVNKAIEEVTPYVDSTFEKARRVGSGSHAEEIGRVAGDISTDIYSEAYDTERDRQLKAGLLAPTYAAEDYKDIAALGKAGELQEFKSDEYLQDEIDRWDFEQNKERDKLLDYSRLLQGGSNFGTTESESSKDLGFWDFASTGLGALGWLLL